ncbi:MAG: RNA polymerase sigma factor [Verrucomicrobiia bacterium]
MANPSDGADVSPKAVGQFATTHWSVVLAAGRDSSPDAQAALERLCRVYWHPLYAHVRRRGYSPEDAQDLTQEFFALLLQKRWLGMADSARGRFRSFLLAALNHFLANEWNRANCVKRGGGRERLSWDTAEAEGLYLRETGTGLSADAVYEKNWTLRLLEQTRGRLRAEYLGKRKTVFFDILERFLPGQESPVTYPEAAAQLGIPEGTLKSDVHRLRQRYGQLLREEIAHTVLNPDEIEDELRHLIDVLGR